jgi:hypothetical protein
MDDPAQRVSDLLRQAAETHHQVYAIQDGDDPDWATWYSDWLTNLTHLADVLGVHPIRSELTFLLVLLDKEYLRDTHGVPWEEFYARRIVEHFRSR